MRVLLRRFARDESGAVLIYVTMIIMVLVGMTALSVNFAFRHVEVNRLQIAADAAALAGASQLSNGEEVVREMAVGYAMDNMPSRGTILLDDDVEIGQWDTGSRQFTVGGSQPNAVRVVTRRATANANAHQVFMAGFPGAPSSVDLSVQSIAWATGASPSSCYVNGMVAGGLVCYGAPSACGGSGSGGGTGSIGAGFCAHGQNGVVMGNGISNNAIAPGSLSAPDHSTIRRANGSVPISWIADEPVSLPPIPASPIVSAFTPGVTIPSFVPNYITNREPRTGFNGNSYISGSLYIEPAGTTVTINANLSNVAIVADNIVISGGNRVLENVFLVARGTIAGTGGNISTSGNALRLGSMTSSASNCNNMTSSVFMAARQDITLDGNNFNISGVQFIAGRNIFSDGNNHEFRGSNSFQAGGNIVVKNNVGPACPKDDHVVIPGESTSPMIVRLVQ